MVSNIDELNESDFERCFVGEPSERPVVDDLRRGRVRRRCFWSITGAVGVAATVAAVTVGTLPAPGNLTAVPARRPTTSASAGPSETARTEPTPSPTPSAAETMRPTSVDTVPPLTYGKRTGYVDRRGHPLNDSGPRIRPFQDTTKHTYDLVREHLDPAGRHLEPYDSYGFSGGGGRDSIEIGQKLGWTIKGQSGQGMLLVSVTRMAPGKQARTTGSEREGLCSGSFVDVSCRRETVAGRTVYVDRQPGGAYVVDYLQPDGELAGAYVDPVFANNTTIPLRGMKVPLADVVALLADPDLDVVG